MSGALSKLEPLLSGWDSLSRPMVSLAVSRMQVLRVFHLVEDCSLESVGDLVSVDVRESENNSCV